MKNEVVPGKLLEELQGRDAIHIAVVSVEAGEPLYHGQPVKVADGKAFYSTEKPVGIVDPFLIDYVYPNSKFWLFLYPNTITGMRHHWSHPAFDDVAEEPPSNDPEEIWAEAFAEGMGLKLSRLMEDAAYYAETGDHRLDNSESYKTQEEWTRFWKYFNKKTGSNVSEDEWAPYTCSC